MRVLLVEDDPSTAKAIELSLASEGIICDTTELGEEGLEIGRMYDYDIIILDLMLPDIDGYEVLRRFRAAKINTPILILSGLSGPDQKIKGLGYGADDYLTKPFSMEELLLRVSAVLKRAKGTLATKAVQREHAIGRFVFDVRKQVLRSEGTAERRLTTKESDLLRLLCEHRNGLLPRSEALKQVWGDDNYFNGRSMDVYIAKLRKYLAPDPRVEIINVHGKGFRLVTREEA